MITLYLTLSLLSLLSSPSLVDLLVDLLAAPCIGAAFDLVARTLPMSCLIHYLRSAVASSIGVIRARLFCSCSDSPLPRRASGCCVEVILGTAVRRTVVHFFPPSRSFSVTVTFSTPYQHFFNCRYPRLALKDSEVRD